MAEEMDREGVADTGAKGAILNIGGAAVAKVSSLLFYIVLLRFVSASDGGIYFLSLAVASILALAGAFGMGDSLYRFIPYYEGSGRKGKIIPLVFTVGTAFVLSSIIIALLAYVSRDFITQYYNNELGAVLPETIAIGIATSLSGMLSSVLLGMKKFGTNAFYSAAQPVVKLVLVAMAFIFVLAPNLQSALYLTLISVVIFDIPMLLAVLADLRKVEGKLELLGMDEIREITSYGIAAVLNQFSNYLMGWTDTLVLAYYVAAPVVGAYNAIISMARTAMQTASQQIYIVLTSMLSHLHGAKSDIFGPLASNAARWSAYITAPIAVISIYFAKEIIQLFFPVYGEYYWLMYAFIPGFFINVFSYPARSALSAMGRTDLLFKSTLVGIIPNAILNLVLVPQYGVLGAIFSTTLTYVFSELVAMWYAHRIAKFTLHPMLGKVALPTIAMSAAVVVSYMFLFNYSGQGTLFELIGVGLASLLGSLVYSVALVKGGGLNKTDYMLVDKVVHMSLKMARLDWISPQNSPKADNT